MPQESAVDLPVEPFVVDLRRRAAAIMVLIASPFAALTLLVALANTNIPSLASQGLDFTAVILIASVVGSAYVYFNLKRIELYNDRVRLFPSRGEPHDVPYSRLDAVWGMNARGYRFVVLSDKDDPDSTWRVYNTRIRDVDLWLFEWLLKKVDIRSH